MKNQITSTRKISKIWICVLAINAVVGFGNYLNNPTLVNSAIQNLGGLLN